MCRQQKDVRAPRADDFSHEHEDYLKWCKLPKINNYHIRSIKTDEDLFHWTYSCHFDKTGGKAIELSRMGKPPREILRLFGMQNINGKIFFVRGLTFNITNEKPWFPQSLVHIHCRIGHASLYHHSFSTMVSQYATPPNRQPTCEIGIEDCDYGKKILNILNKKF